MKELVLDVSMHDTIDLQAWKQNRNLWGVIIKAGGNETHLGRYKDPKFEQHYQNAVKAGLHIGFYYYTVSADISNAKADAEHFANLIGGRAHDLPCYMDVEDPRQFRLSARALTDIIKAFCDTLKSKGYYAGLYTGGSAWLNNMYSSELTQYADWIAWWQASWPTAAGDIGLWQQGGMRYSDGSIVFDDVSGYHDCNWCVVDYPSIIKNPPLPNTGDGKKMINPSDIAAKIHYDMVTDERNGYSQSPRWGGDHPDGVKHLTIDGLDYEYKLGSYDCSSSCITAWRQAIKYTKYKGTLDNATYTGDMKKVFVNSGLFTASLTPAKRGDLYLNEGKHVAMCQDGGSDGVFGYDCLTEFNRNENHAATGGRVGDQDNYESILRSYYNDNWNTVLHYVGGKLDSTVATVSAKNTISKPTEPVSNDILEDNKMACFVKFDGDQTEHFFDGTAFHALKYSHEKDAIIQFYKKNGWNLNSTPIEIGSAESPFGARLIDAFLRGPEFKTMNLFEKHESLSKKIDILSKQVADLIEKLEKINGVITF